MISRHCQHEQMRRDIATSTDPQWHRDRLGVPQYSRTFIIVVWFIGFMAAWGIFAATASI